MRRFLTNLGLAAVLLAGHAQAAPPWKEGDAGRSGRGHQQQSQSSQQPTTSLADAVSHVKASTGGRIVGASQSIDRSGAPVYLIKVLMPNGVVRTMRVPAR